MLVTMLARLASPFTGRRRLFWPCIAPRSLLTGFGAFSARSVPLLMLCSMPGAELAVCSSGKGEAIHQAKAAVFAAS